MDMWNYIELFWNTMLGTFQWTWNMIIFEEVWYKNYFYGLILISLWVWVLEIYFPWRKQQKVVREDFWLDGFYMFFNFFLFSIVISGLYKVIEETAGGFGLSMNSLALVDISTLNPIVALLVFFILNDFVQWFTHVLLHRFEFLWRFHKVHHSVREMGFAAHLRYHWMENLLYKPLKTFAIMLLGGFEPEQAFMLHFFAVAIGHLNHANVRITWGPLKYIFNNSVMHLYHHAKELPEGQMPGVNFGISLSLWDYIFRTNYIPQDQNGSYELGFEDIDSYPRSFFGQLISGFRNKK